ncbi:MAG: glycogen debranching protein [Egibacteraceae bacterium]
MLQRSAVAAVVVAMLALPGVAPAAPHSSGDKPAGPELSVARRLEDRRYVAVGDRAYVVGTQAGRFPAMGFHTRGEMGGIWSPPIKLLDGLWFGIDGEWLGEATRFTSGHGYVRMDLPDQDGMTVTRTEFAPDGHRAVLVGLSFTAPEDGDRSFRLQMDAHSELMGVYPWSTTNPSQSTFNLPDSVRYRRGQLVFRERGRPPVDNAEPHDWAAAVGSNLEPVAHETGDDFRGPQDPPTICAAPPAPNNEPEGGCDDTEVGKGRGGRLAYDVTVPAGETTGAWFAVAGSESGPADALAGQAAVLAHPQRLLDAKVAERKRYAGYTTLDLPGDPRLASSIDWSKQNLADSVQVAEDLEIRETNAGANYPPPEGEIDRVRFLGAGFPDYPWMFGTDGEFTAFASVGVGQFEPIMDHLRGLRDASEIDNDGSGKVVHEVMTDGSVYFGSNADPGNTDETSKFPSAVALLWRWTGDDTFLDEMYDFTVRNMRYVYRELDEDGDGWPEGLGNVEREGMGEEKLDVTTSTIRGLYDLADMARAQRDRATARWATRKAYGLLDRFEREWWMPRIPQHADSLTNPRNDKIQQRHWIGVTPMEIELVRGGRVVPGMTTRRHGNDALDLRETDCYSGDFGLFHTGAPGCDPAVSERPAEKTIFTLNTAIMAVGEGNYGRLGTDQQRRYTAANQRLQLPNPDEQPGAMPEIAPSPDYGRSINRPFNERAMVLQAWGAYGTVWPVVHQQLGVRPDLGRGRLEVVPQVPPGSPRLRGRNIRLAEGFIDVAAARRDDRYVTTVWVDVALRRLRIGHTVPRHRSVRRVTLDGRAVDYQVRRTNRGNEVTVRAPRGGTHQVVVRTR